MDIITGVKNAPKIIDKREIKSPPMSERLSKAEYEPLLSEGIIFADCVLRIGEYISSPIVAINVNITIVYQVFAEVITI